MSDKPVFAEQAQQFAEVVEALLQNEGTRKALVDAPLATLKKYGIEFKNATVGKAVEKQLAAAIGSGSSAQPDPDHPFPRTAPACLTWVAKGDFDDVIRIDESRVETFLSQATLEYKVKVLERRLARLEGSM